MLVSLLLHVHKDCVDVMMATNIYGFKRQHMLLKDFNHSIVVNHNLQIIGGNATVKG